MLESAMKKIDEAVRWEEMLEWRTAVFYVKPHDGEPGITSNFGRRSCKRRIEIFNCFLFNSSCTLNLMSQIQSDQGADSMPASRGVTGING
jgi:hypothetical protein